MRDNYPAGYRPESREHFEHFEALAEAAEFQRATVAAFLRDVEQDDERRFGYRVGRAQQYTRLREFAQRWPGVGSEGTT